MNQLLPVGGENLFQKIKRICTEAEANGIKLYKLSIGQPSGPALKSARDAAARYVTSEDERWHEYADNGCSPIPDFAQRFVQAHVRTDLANISGIDFMPIPGIKPMLGLVILACNAEEERDYLGVATMTKPGYPVPADWSDYLGVTKVVLRTDISNGFLPSIEESHVTSDIHLAMLNFPHNPSGQIPTREFWKKTCAFCVENGIRLFNDGAYLMLAHNSDCFSLADVAVEFPELSWIEAYSASKAIGNGTGWRVGAVAGSSDFVSDLRTIKGNTDSGFFSPAAGGALFALENDEQGIVEVREIYRKRIELLIPILSKCGMKLAVEPGAGFFTLWQSPKRAFGRKMASAEEFNQTMIFETGIVGVHFDPYMRYAVCGPVEDWIDPIKAAFEKARVEY